MNIMSFVDKGQLEPGSTLLLHNKVLSVVGLLADETDPMVSVMKARSQPPWHPADLHMLRCETFELVLRQAGKVMPACFTTGRGAQLGAADPNSSSNVALREHFPM